MHFLRCIVLAFTLLANSLTGDSDICVPCAAEATAFVTAENILIAAEMTLQAAKEAFEDDPSTENASALCTAQNIHAAALATYSSALSALQDCLSSGGPIIEDTISILE